MKKAVIMLVEDEESLASFVITELELEGYEVIWAKDGREALEIFKEKDITLILLDWMLPIYDGLTVLRRIRQSSNVPIIMITARSQTSDISMALDQGLDDYIKTNNEKYLLDLDSVEYNSFVELTNDYNEKYFENCS